MNRYHRKYKVGDIFEYVKVPFINDRNTLSNRDRMYEILLHSIWILVDIEYGISSYPYKLITNYNVHENSQLMNVSVEHIKLYLNRLNLNDITFKIKV